MSARKVHIKFSDGDRREPTAVELKFLAGDYLAIRPQSPFPFESLTKCAVGCSPSTHRETAKCE